MPSTLAFRRFASPVGASLNSLAIATLWGPPTAINPLAVIVLAAIIILIASGLMRNSAADDRNPSTAKWVDYSRIIRFSNLDYGNPGENMSIVAFGFLVMTYEPDGFLAFGSSFNRITIEQVSNNRII
ncbi:unnamed protein product [Linum tenue]|uniref:Uncharacterized protein n=1 Tax=Linum tenue TaxID=586396 RepID=A0AAV0HNA2_9ROSI|nr:unnamed protein product [Linum tenue]